MTPNSFIEKVTNQAKKSADDIKKVQNDQVEIVVNVAWLILIQIGIFKFMLGNW